MSDPLKIRPRPSVPEVLLLVKALYQEHLAGCCLHVQLDDGNLSDAFFDDESRQTVLHCGNAEHLHLFNMLAKMTHSKRARVRARKYET